MDSVEDGRVGPGNGNAGVPIWRASLVSIIGIPEQRHSLRRPLLTRTRGRSERKPELSEALQPHLSHAAQLERTFF